MDVKMFKYRSVMSDSLRPMDCSPPSSSVHEILQARILEWVAISFSRGSSRPRDQTQVSHIAGRRFSLCTTREAKSSKLVLPVCVLSRVWLFETLWNVAHQAPLFTGFPRQEYWSELPFPFPGGSSWPRIKAPSPASAGRFFTTEPWEAHSAVIRCNRTPSS